MEIENNIQSNESDAPSVSSLRWSLRFLFKVVLPIACIAAAVGGAFLMIKTAPKVEPERPPLQAKIVTVESVQLQDIPIHVNALGTVVSARDVMLSPEVSGQINYMSPEVIPGGLIMRGQELIRIDQRDYEAIVKQRESEVTRAELALKLEQGNQVVAAQEYEMLSEIIEDNEKELVLRQPHLEQAQADLAATKAALSKARLDVNRCTVTAPFNAIIQDKMVDVGARVSSATSLLSILGTDEFWIDVKVPVNELKWITIPTDNETSGSAVKITNPGIWSPDQYRQGTVVRLLGQLENKGRRAQLLVSVQDPLCLKKSSALLPKLLIDSYVSVEIAGQMLNSVIPVKRDYLHDGQYVWVINEQSKLEIRQVQTVFRDNDFVYVTEGLQSGERIVTSDLSAPVEGMLLSVEADLPSDGQDKSEQEEQQ